MFESNDLTKEEMMGKLSNIKEVVEDIKDIANQVPELKGIINRRMPGEMLLNLKNAIEREDKKAWKENLAELNAFLSECQPLRKKIYHQNLRKENDNSL